MTKTVLFDLDGTLTDPYQGIVTSIKHALTELGVTHPPESTLAGCIGPPLRDSFAQLLNITDSALIEQAITLYRDRFASRGLYENRVYAGIETLLAQLRAQNYRQLVATSKPTVYADKIIDHFRLRRFFDRVYGSELDGTRGDKTELIRYILGRERLAADRTTMIGDRQHDVIGARNNNLFAIGVLWGYGSRDELRAAGVDALCEQPGDLLPLLLP